jgi:hypothetical protein
MKQRLNVITLGVTDLERAPDQAGQGCREVAHNPHWTVTADGGVKLASAD